MALDLNGFAVFRSIGSHPDAFPSIAKEAAKLARSLVTTQIKAKSADLGLIRGICVALGADAFDLILDGFTDAQLKSVLSKIDKYHPDLKIAEPAWRLDRLRALAHGAAEPATKQKPARGSAKVSKRPTERAAVPERLSYISAGAKRQR
jgi:hypothetical protein